jgi:hypothetical protein
MGSFDAKKRHQKSHAWAPLRASCPLIFFMILSAKFSEALNLRKTSLLFSALGNILKEKTAKLCEALY